ncbi:GNAT family N-acetyltransferase [Azotosporobacter soli]|uniref:GNAT family N-acetyltransferase n=1 Tax=Azotosporobacter soli TaxID=3055040 RepID=UPI0031FE8038
MKTESDFQIRPATTADTERIVQLLNANDLPSCGLQGGSQQFWLAVKKGEAVGVIGLGRNGKRGLLRSLAVAKAYRNNGIAKALLEEALFNARQAKIEEIYLLTGTAKDYFLRKGFSLTDRASLPPMLLQDAGMENACSACSDCLYRSLLEEEKE